ncbi:TonB-dependent siderophore receptor [Pseudohoeflea suaedae]|uniref:TonB-dependent siderophore receptor n=1 Tax=Pseudohoeflea suaedae TaxID=877384 RepID=A0A4R5PLF1_9HYPH|nr:TonB-dependent siderophore receptor [Pseudohoeflea suaedae]TDH37648.1 TonB-dependent siderophore receptor [Pseudohoeflea suaedae]
MSFSLRHHRLLTCSVAILALAASAANSAHAQNATQLEQITVEGGGAVDGAGGTGIEPVAGVVAKSTRTGSKTAMPITEIPQSVSVIGREEIDDQGAQKADEALRYTSGVFTQPFGDDSDMNWMYIRGFDATQTGVYLDGLQSYSYAFGSFFIDTWNLERIEVLKGAASVLYGGSNPGGVINYVSKHAEFERIRQVETGINDAGTGYVAFDIGDALSDTLAYRVTGKVMGGDGYTDYQDGWRGFIAPTITIEPDAGTSLSISANYTHFDESHSGGSFLPYEGTVTDRIVGGVNHGRIDPDSNFSEPDIDAYEREQASIGYEFSHTFDNDVTFNSSARAIRADIYEHNVYANGWSTIGGDTDLARVNFAHDSTSTAVLMDNNIEWKTDLGPVEHSFLLGADYKYYNIDQVQSSGLFDPSYDNPIDAFDPVHGGPLTPLASYLSQDLTLDQVGVYAQDQMRFGDGWILTANARYDYAWLSVDNRETFYGTGADYDYSVDSVSGRIGLAYEFDNGLTPYVSAATFFNPLIGTDDNGDPFKPEEGEQFEAGIKYAPDFIDGLFTVSVFDLTRRNVPSYVTTFTQMQVGEIRSRGVEAEAKVNVTEDLKLTAAITAYDVDITADDDASLIGKTPYVVPEVMASAWVDYTLRSNDWYDGVTLGAGLRYVGSSWADNANTLKVPDVTLVDFKVGYEKDDWGVDLNVTNAFDETYVSACQGENVCSYGEGRAFKLRAYSKW